MYRIVVYPDAQVQIAALPDDALDAYADVHSVLETVPWNGPPLHGDNPDGAVRRWDFGPGHAGQVVYLTPGRAAGSAHCARPVVRLTIETVEVGL